MALRGRSLKSRKEGELNITSMMDMFTIILVFLLKSYSAEGSILTNADNLVLPNSVSKEKPKEVNLQMSVTHDMIVLDNEAIVPTEEIRKISSENPKPLITKLKEELDIHMLKEEELVKTGALQQVDGNIVIQVDKNMEFDVLHKIMYTCGDAGYVNMKFAVMQREE